MRTIRLTATVLLASAVLALTIHTVLAATAGVGSPVVVAATPGDSQDPVVAYGKGITHAVWVEGDSIMHSYNTGLAWSTPVTVTAGHEPSLVVDHNGVPQLAFTDLSGSTYRVYHIRFISPTWEFFPRQVSSGSNNAAAPDIAVAPDNSLLLVWSEALTTTRQIEIATSSVGGAAWPSFGPISNAHGSAPKVAVDSDGVTHVVWQDDTAAPFRINHIQGSPVAWSVAAIVSSQTASAYAPDLTTIGSEAHIVWEQSSAIQYRYGSNINFSTPVAISSGSGSDPSIAATSSGALIAAWDSGTAITARLGGWGGWGNEQLLGSNGAGVDHVALTPGPRGSVYAVFAAGASGSRDIMFNDYTVAAVYLPLVMR
jgi:hypothetical protein